MQRFFLNSDSTGAVAVISILQAVDLVIGSVVD